MRLLTFVDLYNPDSLLDESGSELRLPAQTLGKVLPLSLRFYDRQGGQRVLRDLDLRALNATVTKVGLPPDADGTFSVLVGNPPAVTSTNATAALPARTTALALAEALTALPALAPYGACSGVDHGDSTWTLTFAGQTGVVPLAGVRLAMTQSCFLRVRPYQDESGTWRHEVRLLLAPVAMTSVANRVAPPAPSQFTRVVGGTTTADVEVNEVQSFTLPPSFLGTYVIKMGSAETGLLDRTDGARYIQAALEAAFGEGNFSVSNPQDNLVVVEFTGDFAAMPMDLLTTEVKTAPAGDWSFTLSFANAAAYRALRSVAEDEFQLEVDAMVANDGDAPDLPGEPRVLLRVPLTLRREARWPGLEAVPSIDYELPPEPNNYLPFNPTQVIFGQQHYAVAFGDGSATEYVITHNLGTQAISGLEVRENVANGRVLVRGTDYTARVVNANQVRITFPASPTLNSVALVVTSAGPKSAFVDDIEIEIGQVVGLSAILSDLGGRMETLESLYAASGVPASSQESGFLIELPETREALFFRGNPTNVFATLARTTIARGRTDDEAKEVFSERKGIDDDALPRFTPFLLPAVHDATVTDVTALPSLAAGEVWKNTSSGNLDVGGGGTGGAVVKPGEFFASDGRIFYKVTRSGTTNSYFPAAFERELWRIAVNPKMLAVGRVLEAQFSVALRMIRPTSNAQWVLVIERGTLPSQATPSPVAVNLQNVVWDPTPVLSLPVLLTPLMISHSAGVRVERTLSGGVETFGLDVMAYGNWEGNDAAAPDSASFALRARLINFDTENDLSGDAKGWVTYQVFGPKGIDENGEQVDRPTATIK